MTMSQRNKAGQSIILSGATWLMVLDPNECNEGKKHIRNPQYSVPNQSLQIITPPAQYPL